MNRCPDCGWPMIGEICEHCKIEDYDNLTYQKFCGPAVIDKTLNTLEGLLTGITIDGELNKAEIKGLMSWCYEHAPLAVKKPYDELFTAIFSAIDDNRITLEEKEDLLWLLQQLHSERLYYKATTCSMQKLQGILHGIMADGKITKEELLGLESWLADNEHLSTYYPYDEIFALVTAVLKDGIVSPDEEKLLKAFFSQFVEATGKTCILSKEEAAMLAKQGICALDPEIDFTEHEFCFTGKSVKATRSEIAKLVNNAGGHYHDAVTAKTNYLIVGNDGNSCWAFSCYGRKVEKAIELRKKGQHIVIVNELDFWDNL